LLENLKKVPKKTGSSLKRTLGASTTSRKKESKKTAEQLPNDQLPSQPPPETPLDPTIITPVLPVIAEPAVQPALAPTSTAPKKQKLYRYPSVLALPSKSAIPIDKMTLHISNAHSYQLVLQRGTHSSMLSLHLPLTAKTTASWYQELLRAILLLFKIVTLL